MCVLQMGGGQGRITEYTGHSIPQSTWHTVFGGERWKYDRNYDLCCSTSRGSAAREACGVKRV